MCVCVCVESLFRSACLLVLPFTCLSACAIATDLGVILSTMECTLKDIRPQINEILSHTCATSGADDVCDQSWTFLNGKHLNHS